VSLLISILLLRIILETFWVELEIRNPLDTDVNLSNFTIIVRESNSPDSESARHFVTVETIKDVILGARESRMV
jgi:hypothetical protein